MLVRDNAPVSALHDCDYLRLDEEAQLAAAQRVLQMAAEARRCPIKFFEFVFRTEHTQAPVEAQPHQVLALRFAEDHPRFVLRMPTGTSKTYLMLAMGLWQLGRDLLSRAAIVSAAEEQAKKPVGVMRSYIEESAQLSLVFPKLSRNHDPDVSWRNDEFTVERPRGIRDPSMRALGMDTKSILGSRLSWALADDTLNGENTATKDQRDKQHSEFSDKVETRLDPDGSRCGVTNTPWDQDDLTFRLERAGWPTLTQGVTGDIEFGGELGDTVEKLYGDLVEPHAKRRGSYRLRRPQGDPECTVPLWPGRYSAAWIARALSRGPGGVLPLVFARQYLCRPFDEGSARCLREWVDTAIKAGFDRKLTWPQKPDGPRRRYTGVDVGGVKKGNDLSSICTIEAHEDGRRRLLNLQSGRWSGPELVRRIRAEAITYDSKVYVESNAAQKFIVDFTREADNRLRVVSFTTSGVNKFDQSFGVEALFTELFRGIWDWPCGPGGKAPEEIASLSDECVFYSPTAHTGDRLMALFLARQGLASPGQNDGAASRGSVGGSRTFAAGGGF